MAGVLDSTGSWMVLVLLDGHLGPSSRLEHLCCLKRKIQGEEATNLDRAAAGLAMASGQASGLAPSHSSPMDVPNGTVPT